MSAVHAPRSTEPVTDRGVQPAVSTAPRPRRISRHRFPAERRLVLAAERAGRRRTPMHGLVQLDVTEPRRLLAVHEPPLSLTAFLIASVARAVAAHPEVHAYRDWRGRLVTHTHVDVATIVEVPTQSGPFPLAHVVRDADVRSVADITAELRAVKVRPAASAGGRLIPRFRRAFTGTALATPLLGLGTAAVSRSVRGHAVIGTVMLTSVGMFAGGGGFGIATPTLYSLQLLVGGVSPRPAVVDGRVEPRDLLDLTLTLDHNVVDGGPAARFGADLRRIVEGAEVLTSASSRQPTRA